VIEISFWQAWVLAGGFKAMAQTTNTHAAKRGSVVVLGANGRLGKSAVAAFYAVGWRVRAFVRNQYCGPASANIECVSGDALDHSAVRAATQGVEVIVNALNIPYGAWATLMPKITDVVIHAARNSGATVLVPGNVYHYGAGMPAVLSETTPANPSTALGKIRHEMEQAYRHCSSDGFKTIILRAGDFFGGNAGVRSGGWFDSHIAANLARAKLVYPGPMECPHAWAFLPDFARAMVALAQRRDSLPMVSSIGFPGFTFTGAELAHALAQLGDQTIKVAAMQWGMVRIGSWFSPDLRGVLQMRYLWHRPHRIDGTQFQSLVPAFAATPLLGALAQSILRPKPAVAVQD
jgi:nucleoside-diphosphate-sugar epimerase